MNVNHAFCNQFWNITKTTIYKNLTLNRRLSDLYWLPDKKKKEKERENHTHNKTLNEKVFVQWKRQIQAFGQILLKKSPRHLHAQSSNFLDSSFVDLMDTWWSLCSTERLVFLYLH